MHETDVTTFAASLAVAAVGGQPFVAAADVVLDLVGEPRPPAPQDDTA